MLERFMSDIKDPEDYITTLSLFRGSPLSEDEVNRLSEIYAKYLPETDDPDYPKICLAVDLLQIYTEAGTDIFKLLGLDSTTLDVLLTTKKLASWNEVITIEDADHIEALTKNKQAPLSARVLLARMALDHMIGSRNFVELQTQVRAMAEFLTGIGAETLDHYTALVMEVRLQCRS